jgi:tetratricopeptide (TPR) repeat protein/predicted Ser/Thr protein kinase
MGNHQTGPAQAIQCPQCGHSNPTGSLRCIFCDNPVSTGDPDPPANLTVNLDWSRIAPEPSEASSYQALNVGDLLSDRYKILELLGQGGMGAVYKALDVELERLVALKVIRPELSSDQKTLKRFKQELILARQITHKNVIRIYDLGSHQNVKYITMEYVEGRDLSTILDERALTAQESARIVRQVCRALEAAHAEDVIHRDLKPQNIMVDETGRVRVMDFGLARSVEMSGLTQTGAVLGTPAFMSPEQARGVPLDSRSDLFSLGIIFYRLLTGTIPFQADTVWAMLLARTHTPPEPPVALDPAIPKALSDITMKCLAIDPAARYQTAAEAAADLDAWLGDAQPASIVMMPPPVAPAPSAPPRRKQWITAGLAAVALLAIAAGIVLWQRPPAKKPNAVSVLVADFDNHTGDPVFDETLEPMFNIALEGATFINAYNRGQARKLAGRLPHPTDKLDEQSARLIATSQGLGAVVTGSLSRRGNGYRLSVEAMDAVTGNTIANADFDAPNKDQVLLAIPKLVVPIRKALGDTVPESAQLSAAGGSFTAASLEVVHQYGVGMEQQFAGKMGDALGSFSKASELDPAFARAWAGMAAVSGNMGRLQDAENYAKLAMAHVDRMTERERYRIRGLYYVRTGNWQKCVEEYTELVNQYPADNIGHNNLAGCLAHQHNMAKAMEVAQQALRISPKDLVAHMNLALYACYAGDFQTSLREAGEVLKLNPSYQSAYLVLAYAQMGQGQTTQAAETYSRLAKIGARGASLSAAGLANLAIYDGRFREAIQILEKGAAADLATKETDAAADKFSMLSYVQLLRGDKRSSIAAGENALAKSQSPKIRFLVARTLLEAGDSTKAQELSAGLGSDLKSEPQAYAKLIAGELALKENNPQQAVSLFTEAVKLTNGWIGLFDLGRAYLHAGAYTEADSEFDMCIRRRGEVMELFLDDMPTSGYFPPVYYYLGRVREGLKSPGAPDSYKSYIAIRGKSGEDPIIPEIQKRLQQQPAQ